jgi:hypothetical protein
MKLTPAILRQCYELLRETPPFDRWHLPAATEIKFKVRDYAGRYGLCETDWKKRRYHETQRSQITISSRTVHTLERLMRVMAHEMIHVRQAVTAKSGTDHKRSAPHHGADFMEMQSQIAKHHRWDDPLT